MPDHGLCDERSPVTIRAEDARWTFRYVVAYQIANDERMYTIRFGSFAGALAIVGLRVTYAFAQNAEIPECARATATASRAMVLGFPGEKVRVFAAHPLTCGALPGNACKAVTLISTGTPIGAGGDCDGWTLVQDAQPTPALRGWMATRRVMVAPPDSTEKIRPLLIVTPHLPPPNDGSTIRSAADAKLCVAVRDDLNAGGGMGEWPSRQLPISSLPPHLAAALAEDAEPGSMSVLNVRLPRGSIKLVAYRGYLSGMHEGDDIVTLWSSDFGQEITTTRLGNNDLTQQLVDIAGVPVFTEENHNTEAFTVSRLVEGSSLENVCTLEVEHYEGPEVIESAAEPEVCDAALKGTVENVILSDVVPYSLTGRELSASAGAPDSSVLDFDIVAVGDVDLDNDRTLDRVGWAQSEPLPNAASPDPMHMEWPVILATDGTPRPGTPLNLAASRASGNDSTGRLFRFRGSTYFETHWLADSRAHVHEIWKFAGSEGKRVCTFSTHQSQRYEIALP